MKLFEKINQLKENRDFLSLGAEELKIAGMEPAWVIVGRMWDKDRMSDVTDEVNALIKRNEIKVGYGYSRNLRPPLKKGHGMRCGKRVRVAKFCGGVLHFIISPDCHGNGGWCGQTIEKVGTLIDLLAVCPGHIEHHPYAHDPEPRICTEPDVNNAIIKWDSDALNWKDMKTDKVLVQFSSTTTYQLVS